jgi:hypothetical protein
MQRFILAFALLACFHSLLFGQKSDVPVRTTRYTLEELTTYKVPQGAAANALSPLDKVLLLPKRLLRQVETHEFADGSTATTIQILNPTEAFAEWPVKMGRIEYDNSGTRIYDTEGKLYQDIPSDSARSAERLQLAQLRQNNSSDAPTSFPMPDAGTLSALQNSGYVVNNLPQGAVKLGKDNLEALYEPQQMRITRTKYHNDSPVESSVRKYALSDDQRLRIVYERDEVMEFRPSGACMERVTQRRYTNYSTDTDSRYAKPAAAPNAGPLQVWPNPASDYLYLTPDAGVLPGSSAEIINALGVTVRTQHNIQAGVRLEIPLAGLPAGAYFLRVQGLEGARNVRFAVQR